MDMDMSISLDSPLVCMWGKYQVVWNFIHLCSSDLAVSMSGKSAANLFLFVTFPWNIGNGMDPDPNLAAREDLERKKKKQDPKSAKLRPWDINNNTFAIFLQLFLHFFFTRKPYFYLTKNFLTFEFGKRSFSMILTTRRQDSLKGRTIKTCNINHIKGCGAGSRFIDNYPAPAG